MTSVGSPAGTPPDRGGRIPVARLDSGLVGDRGVDDAGVEIVSAEGRGASGPADECLDLRAIDLRTAVPVPVTAETAAESRTRPVWRPGGAANPGTGDWFMADGIVVTDLPLTPRGGVTR